MLVNKLRHENMYDIQQYCDCSFKLKLETHVQAGINCCLLFDHLWFTQTHQFWLWLFSIADLQLFQFTQSNHLLWCLPGLSFFSSTVNVRSIWVKMCCLALTLQNYFACLWQRPSFFVVYQIFHCRCTAHLGLP